MYLSKWNRTLPADLSLIERRAMNSGKSDSDVDNEYAKRDP